MYFEVIIVNTLPLSEYPPSDSECIDVKQESHDLTENNSENEPRLRLEHDLISVTSST